MPEQPKTLISSGSGIEKVHRNSIRITVDLWRSRRDSNPRAAFDDYTISSRARYDLFDTTPYIVHRETVPQSVNYYTAQADICQEENGEAEEIFLSIFFYEKNGSKKGRRA